MKTLTLAKAIVAAALFTGSAQAAAQLPQENDKLESVGELTLRAASPDSSFGTKGEKIGWVKQGETVKVLSVKQVSTVFGFEVWIEVEASQKSKGWIFDGMSEEVLKGRANLSSIASTAMMADAD